MVVEYFLRWAWGDRRARDFMPEAEARARHERGELYYVKLPQVDGAYCVIQVKSDSAVVIFVDACNRYVGVYQFNKEPDDRAFLEHTKVWAFDSSDQTQGSFFHSRTLKEGTALCTTAAAGSNTREEFQADVSPEEMRVHWDWFPEFGRYDHICIFDRKDVGAAPDAWLDQKRN